MISGAIAKPPAPSGVQQGGVVLSQVQGTRLGPLQLENGYPATAQKLYDELDLQRATGRQGGTYLFAGPRWNGTVPKGITQIFHSETNFVGTLTHTQLNGPADSSALPALQAQYTLTLLSSFSSTATPPAPPQLPHR